MKKVIASILISLSCFLGFAQGNMDNSKYILTPAESPVPRINGAKVFGIRPGHPIYFKVSASGEKPLTYMAKGLPEGVEFDSQTGIFSGQVKEKGDYKVKVTVKNKYGKCKDEIHLVIGDKICLTPPMGWNSWNAWGLAVTQKAAMETAQAFIDLGLIDYGWSYVNLDDGWEFNDRKGNEGIQSNEKFPNMAELGKWIHEHGMKFGIYSSPGPYTCGGYLGSYQHEEADARRFAEWGVDYLKYDLCSYKWEIQDKQNDTTINAWIKPFMTMRKALDKLDRDIVYSVCSYNSIPWIETVGGNLTRLSTDIRDSWKSLLNNGFGMNEYAPYHKPGRWNDPDMLVLGTTGGWGGNYQPTHLTADEQYTHFSLWCLYSAPLLLGCDMTKMDDFTLSLLKNAEMIDVNQDPAGKQAIEKINEKTYKVYVKEMSDGSHVVGIFNISDKAEEVTVSWEELGIKGGKVRDLWRQVDLGKFKKSFTTRVNSHGTVIISIK